jgi:hypothetical protein
VVINITVIKKIGPSLQQRFYDCVVKTKIACIYTLLTKKKTLYRSDTNSLSRDQTLWSSD